MGLVAVEALAHLDRVAIGGAYRSPSLAAPSSVLIPGTGPLLLPFLVFLHVHVGNRVSGIHHLNLPKANALVFSRPHDALQPSLEGLCPLSLDYPLLEHSESRVIGR